MPVNITPPYSFVQYVDASAYPCKAVLALCCLPRLGYRLHCLNISGSIGCNRSRATTAGLPLCYLCNAGEEHPIQNIIATTAYWLTRDQVRRLARFSGGVINTGRPFRYYRKVFFNNRSKADILASLQGKTVVDIGCGYTPFVPDSMFRACHDAGIPFYGVDPIIKKTMNFKASDAFYTRMTGGSGTLDANAPGVEKAISALADDLPFADDSVDVILSNWLILIWINEEVELLKIFSEFYRVLKAGGSFNLYPLPDWHSFQFKNPQLKALLRQFEINQHFVYAGFNLQYPSCNRVSFTKKGL
jgi:SAM-dependent methyltransferase